MNDFISNNCKFFNYTYFSIQYFENVKEEEARLEQTEESNLNAEKTEL